METTAPNPAYPSTFLPSTRAIAQSLAPKRLNVGGILRKTENGRKGCRLTGGEGGIRTHDTLARIPVFETGTFNHSATSPEKRILADSEIAVSRASPIAYRGRPRTAAGPAAP